MRVSTVNFLKLQYPSGYQITLSSIVETTTWLYILLFWSLRRRKIFRRNQTTNQNFCCTQVLNKLFWEELLTQNLIIATEKLPVTKQSQQLRSSDGDEMAKRQFQCDFHFRIWFRLTVLGLGKYQELAKLHGQAYQTDNCTINCWRKMLNN